LVLDAVEHPNAVDTGQAICCTKASVVCVGVVDLLAHMPPNRACCGEERLGEAPGLVARGGGSGTD
jgi:hypothetical protein